MALCECITIVAILILARIQNSFKIRDYASNVAFRAALTFIVLSGVAIISHFLLPIDGIKMAQVIFYALALVVVSLIAITTILFTPAELHHVIQIVRNRKRKV